MASVVERPYLVESAVQNDQRMCVSHYIDKGYGRILSWQACTCIGNHGLLKKKKSFQKY